MATSEFDRRGRQLDSTALRYFHAAALLGSIRGAADTLNASGSAVSRRIAGLEEDLKVALFERLPRGLKLTSAGEVLLHHVERSFTELQQAREAIEELKGLRRGHIHLAVVESVARGVLPRTLSQFWSKHPDIKVSVHVLGSLDVVRAVETGEAHIGLAFNVSASVDLPTVEVAAFNIGAVMPVGHPLANMSRLRLQDLGDTPLFVSDSSLMLHETLVEAQKAAQLRIRLVTNSITLMGLLADGGDGAALMIKTGVLEELRRGDLFFAPLVDDRLPLQRLSLITRRGITTPALIDALTANFNKVLSDVADT